MPEGDVDRRGIRAVATIVVLTLAGALVATSVPANASSDSDVARELTRLVNDARSSHGIATVHERGDIVEVAARWSAKMASDGVLRHNPGYAAQVCCWEVVTENVGMASVSGADTPQSLAQRLHQGFMDSPSHRDKILDTRVSEVGVAAASSDDAVWVTILFRRPDAATSTSTAEGGTSPGVQDSEPSGAAPSEPSETTPSPSPQPEPSAEPDPEPEPTPSASAALDSEHMAVQSSTYEGPGPAVAAAFHRGIRRANLSPAAPVPVLSASTGAVRTAASLLVLATALLVMLAPAGVGSRGPRRHALG